jgi:hypothetical protein
MSAKMVYDQYDLSPFTVLCFSQYYIIPITIWSGPAYGFYVMALIFAILPLFQCNFQQHSRSCYWFRRSSTQRLPSPGKADYYSYGFIVWEKDGRLGKVLTFGLYYLIATCWRISWAVCQDKDFLFYRSCVMGCWFLCQSRWRRSCQFRYICCLRILGFFPLFSCHCLPKPLLLFSPFSLNSNFSLCYSLGVLAATLARHRSKPRVYIGCMKSGPVLSRK